MLVIVGASLAGTRAAQAARRVGYAGPITILGEEPHLPYDRPPLSKSYLADDGVPDHLLTEEELEQLNIALRLSTRATALDPRRRTVSIGDEQIEYEAVVIATGSTPRRLAQLPDLDGVVTLRTLDDADDLRRRLQPGLHVVIVGGGFIGSEIASSARQAGATVTILEGAAVPLVRAVGPTVGAAISTLHDRNGVQLVCGAQVASFEGDETGRVTHVLLADGTAIRADLVVVGIGSVPETSWLHGSGIELHPADGGIVCDEFLCSSIPGVYAAGDVAHWPNPLMGLSMRLENWTNAADQGARAGMNAVSSEAGRVPHESVPYFWSDWYGNRIQFVGSAEADCVRFASGSPDDDRFVALYSSGQRLVGAACLNEQRKVMKLRRLIGARGTLDDATDLLAAIG